MNRFTFAAAALALGTSALAAHAASPAAEQLAAKLGLNADAYSVTELNIIDQALRDGDANTVNLYVKGGNRAALADSVTPGSAQLAANLGLDPAKYSLTELSIIDSARKAKNADVAAFYTSGRNRDIRGGVGEASEGKAQLAASLRVNAADYSLAELTSLYLASVTP
ncbi:hypothetical protein [Tabrizicola fusiformis]|uniref:hypothetical protein n=1 Tax=Tabrizicola sp. SY72 TaxID=2741673 RepID=UPI001573003E|nr:hypothetical protein [Tabrizicola sp. SY72]NTT86560.1 hypothetical protein [Tabrizicola sp. SY72]